MAAGVTMAEVMEVEGLEEEVMSVLVLDSVMVMAIMEAIAVGGAQVIMGHTGMITIAALAEVIPISRGYAIGKCTIVLAPILKSPTMREENSLSLQAEVRELITVTALVSRHVKLVVVVAQVVTPEITP